MRRSSFLTILIVSCLVINTLPALSINNQVSTNTEPIKETLESILNKTSEKTENIPFVSQEKPDFLNMEKASAGNSPQENIIIVHIKKIRLLDETIEEPEYYIDIKINGKKTKVERDTTILKAAREMGAEIPSLCHHPMEIGRAHV